MLVERHVPVLYPQDYIYGGVHYVVNMWNLSTLKRFCLFLELIDIKLKVIRIIFLENFNEYLRVVCEKKTVRNQLIEHIVNVYDR